ncbi:hypothetical protein V1478_002356 [Vespula squamosa]|uniref:Uncharacterized protein n=1 Tax=Vespula squamosa TaxID=30214 RepID=A0ABD2BVL3_VESSQ
MSSPVISLQWYPEFEVDTTVTRSFLSFPSIFPFGDCLSSIGFSESIILHIYTLHISVYFRSFFFVGIEFSFSSLRGLN